MSFTHREYSGTPENSHVQRKESLKREGEQPGNRALDFWRILQAEYKNDDLVERHKESMTEHIRSTVLSDYRIIVIDASDPLTLKDQARMSAYRSLARDMGYEIGPFDIDKKSRLARAKVITGDEEYLPGQNLYDSYSG